MKRKDHEGRTLKQNPEDLITVDGNHEPIVTEEQWQLVQEKKKRLGEKYEKPRDRVNDNILAGIVKCPICGKSLVGFTGRKKKKDGSGYYNATSHYVCRHNRKSNGETCSFNRSLKQEILDGITLEILSKLRFHEQFKAELTKAMGMNASLEEKKENLKDFRAELRKAELEKERLGNQLDGLNPLRDDYDANYDLISEKLDDLYDRIEELEDAINIEKTLLESLQRKHDSMANVDKFLSNLEALIERMTSKEKKELCNSLIERIDIYPEERDDGRIIKNITFKFPVEFKGLETIEQAGPHISFSLDCEEIEMALPSKGRLEMETTKDGRQKVVIRKPTYPAIRNYVKEKFGSHVSTLNIAQTKRKYGIEMGKAYNKPENPKSKISNCTPEKERMILDALKHFGVLDQSIEYKEGDNHDKN